MACGRMKCGCLPFTVPFLGMIGIGIQSRSRQWIALASHLLQQVVDERAPEHVEKTGSKPSMGA